MRVGLVLPNLKPGGSQKVFTELYCNWRKEDVCYLIILNEVTEDEIAWYNLDEKNLIKLNNKRTLFSILDLIRAIKRFKIDVIFSTLTHVNILSIIAAKLTQTLIIIRESSVFSVMLKFGMKKMSLKVLIKFFYRFSNFIICQSNDIKNDFMDLLSIETKKLKVIPNPISKVKYDATDRPLLDETLNIINVGRISPEKGQERLIRICSQLQRDFKLEIVGDGDEKEKCSRIANELNIQDKVIFSGWVSNPEKLLKKSSVYVQTSYVEGFPNILLEACAVGLPIVAFDVPGGTKEIINEINGFLVNDGDNNQLIKLLDEFDQNNFKSEDIIQDVFERFNISAVLNNYYKLIDIKN